MAKILIVDDTAFMRRLLEQILQAAGYEVACAVDGQECLDMVGAEKPDLVIMDWNMPRMDGLEATRALRADPVTRSLPVLVASASSQDVDIAEMKAAGANGHVSKPFQAEQLLTAVRQYLSVKT
ncbi:MAG: hypothetical protein B6I35_08530 [Anaerolineaceae bacterium 4572_32.2]|nr:MAG: hypothetical protein B6I35_08530 [Anaerolineaceae bacterium 4572_32.2]HEY73228.1 response regulator [Thermoflexia bacterium]